MEILENIFKDVSNISNNKIIKGKKTEAIKHFFAISSDIPQLSYVEKLFLYTFILSIPDRKCLEIGSAEGGSARIISSALSIAGGELTCIDPVSNRLSIPIWEEIKHNTTFIKGTSPESLDGLGKFDFVFVDGDHTENGVYSDAIGLLPHLNSNAYILFHDFALDSVKKAIVRALEEVKGYTDCGYICHETTSIKGFKLLRFTD